MWATHDNEALWSNSNYPSTLVPHLKASGEMNLHLVHMSSLALSDSSSRRYVYTQRSPVLPQTSVNFSISANNSSALGR